MEDMMEIDRTCPWCWKKNTIHVPKDKYHRWINGDLVQNCFADLSAEDREILMTGFCPKCWEAMFKDI